MKLPTHLRRSSAGHITLFALVCATSLAAGLAAPVYSAATQTGAPADAQTMHEQERAAHQWERETRERERAEQRAAREHEREALQAKREEERTARQNARNTGLHGCQLTIEASSQRITAGESVTLSGALTCPTGTSTTHQTNTDGQTSAAEQTSAAGQQVALYVRQLGPGAQISQNLAAAQTVSTAADGSYDLTSPILDKTSILQVRVGRHHARVVVKVAPLVTLTQSDATFSGTVSPAVEGERMALQISYPSTEEHWQTVAYARVSADGSYSIAHAFHHQGRVNVRTVAHPHGPDVKGISAPVAYEVLEPSPSGLASQLTPPAPVTNA
jgi:hypothetical protein